MVADRRFMPAPSLRSRCPHACGGGPASEGEWWRTGVDPFRLVLHIHLICPHILPRLPFCSSKWRTRRGAASAAVPRTRVFLTARRASRATRVTSTTAFLSPGAHQQFRSRGVPKAQEDPSTGGQHGQLSQRTCAVTAPYAAGTRGRATLPQLDWGRPSRVRTSARTRWCPPGIGEHGVRNPRLCPVRPGHGHSGHSVPTGPLAFGTPLALDTHLHRIGTPERRFYKTN